MSFEILKSLAGTFIASTIIVRFTMSMLGFREEEEAYRDFIGWLSLISTILYWRLENWLERISLNSPLTPDPNSFFSETEQYQIARLATHVKTAFLFIVITTIGLWIFVVILSIINPPTNFCEFLCLLLKMLVIAVILGISLRFVSCFTTQWVNHPLNPFHSSLILPNQGLGLLIH